jgi:hypothetical protein
MGEAGKVFGYGCATRFGWVIGLRHLNPKNAVGNLQYCVVARFIGRFLKPPMNRQTTEKFADIRRWGRTNCIFRVKRRLTDIV